MQRALLQYFLSHNRGLVVKALRKAGRADLIGSGPECLVPAPVGEVASGQRNGKGSVHGSRGGPPGNGGFPEGAESPGAEWRKTGTKRCVEGSLRVTEGERPGPEFRGKKAGINYSRIFGRRFYVPEIFWYEIEPGRVIG